MGHFRTSGEFVPILMAVLINQKDPGAKPHSGPFRGDVCFCSAIRLKKEHQDK